VVASYLYRSMSSSHRSHLPHWQRSGRELIWGGGSLVCYAHRMSRSELPDIIVMDFQTRGVADYPRLET
jgi:hypothetical protein